MKLALFDLDNTLLPMDSDHGWSQFLVDKGLLDRDRFEAKNNYFYEQYKAGTLNIYEYLEFNLAVLHENPRAKLNVWHQQYMTDVIKPHLRQSAIDLVNKHKSEGAICMIITATNSFVTQAIAELFGVTELIATIPEEINGEFTGKVSGEPSFREGKVNRLNTWLSERNWTLGSFESVHFYSDSINDLPLLEQATHPVAVHPDERLAAISRERGWPILELFA